MFRWLIALALLAGTGAVLWQEARYLELRRDRVHDVQPLLHSGDAFHVVTFLHFPDSAPVVSDESDVGTRTHLLANRDLFAALRGLRTAAESGRDAQVVYAGKVAVNALASKQLVDRFGGEVPWSAVLLTQFDSQAAADRVLASEAYLQR